MVFHPWVEGWEEMHDLLGATLLHQVLFDYKCVHGQMVIVLQGWVCVGRGEC